MLTVEITKIGICELLDVIYPGFWKIEFKDQPSYEEQGKAILKWCKDNNFYFYERIREDFFEYEAYELAEKAGCVGVVLSDLS